jgi:hypothetical protein
MRKDLLEDIDRANAEADTEKAWEIWDMVHKHKALIDLLENGSENFEIAYGQIRLIPEHKGYFISDPKINEKVRKLVTEAAILNSELPDDKKRTVLYIPLSTSLSDLP